MRDVFSSLRGLWLVWQALSHSLDFLEVKSELVEVAVQAMNECARLGSFDLIRGNTYPAAVKDLKLNEKVFDCDFHGTGLLRSQATISNIFGIGLLECLSIFLLWKSLEEFRAVIFARCFLFIHSSLIMIDTLFY